MRLRGALLGAGNIALRGHAPQWAEDPVLREAVDIVAVTDLSPSNLEAARAFFPGAAAYARAEEALEREALDFCDVCTPPFSHRGLVEEAARRGVHVICEKPLAPGLPDAESISEAVRRSAIVFEACHQYHFSPQWQAVKRLLLGLGRIYLAEYEVHRTEANEGNPHWSPAWRTDRAFAGGGILVDHGAHIFYQLRSVLGDPRTVQATVRTLQHNYRVEDTALVVLDFGACLAQVRLTWAARRRQIRFRFVGERGELVGDDESVRIHADTSQEIRFADGMSRNSSHSEWYSPLFLRFTERVRRQDLDPAPLDEAVYVTRLISRAYESSLEGRTLPFISSPAEELEAPAEALVASLGAGPDGERADSRAAVERRRRVRVLRAGVAAALLGAGAWTFHDMGWAHLGSALMAAHPGWIALAAAVNLAAVGFQAVRWLALVRPLSPLATLAQAFKSLVVGFAVSTVVPARAGELARMNFLGRRTGLPPASIFSSIVLDHLVNATGLLLGLALLPFVAHVPLWIRPGAAFALALFTVGAMLVYALRPLDAGPPPASLPVKGVGAFLASARQGLAAANRPSALGLSLGASLVSWALEVNVTAIAMRAVGLHLPLSAAFLVLLAVNLALAFPFAPPGNLGTLEVGATLALVGFGVAKEQALAFGLIYHVLQMVPIGILGILFAGRAADGPVTA